MFKPINVAVIGVGWVGGIRARACAESGYVDNLHIAEIDPERAAAVAADTGAAAVTDNWRVLLEDPAITAVIIASTPESSRFEMVREALLAGKHVLVEKPVAPTPQEADEAIALAEAANLKLTVGYTRRFDPKYAYVNKAVKEGKIGEPITVLVSRNLTREIGTKIRGRSTVSPATMGGTHSIDFALWCLQPRLPVKVYSQRVGKTPLGGSAALDHQWMLVTMDDGTTVAAGSGWVLPLGYPRYSQNWIEVLGTEGSLFVDDTHRDVQLNTTTEGIQFPMSSMPGEQVDHVFAGAMVDETTHFIRAVALDTPVLVTPREARLVMSVTMAADTSVETGLPVSLPNI